MTERLDRSGREVPAKYEIGRARAEELGQLSGIELEAAAVFPLEDIAQELRQQGPPLSFFQAAYAAERLWVARQRLPSTPVGFAVASLVDGSAHLYEMDVLPEHARRGLGCALVLEVADWAKASDFPSLTLTTFRHLAWNAPFYASLGFAEVTTSEQGDELRAALAREAEHGLDPNNRLAMKLELASR